MTARRGVRYEADSLLSAAEHRLVKHQLALSSMAPAWDGYCGLVQLRDDDPGTLGATSAAHGMPEATEWQSPGTKSSPFADACQTQDAATSHSEALQAPPMDRGSSAVRQAHSATHMAELHSTAQADACFREAVQLIKRLDLGAAKALLQQARRLCPPDQTEALQRIDKFAAAVQKAL